MGRGPGSEGFPTRGVGRDHPVELRERGWEGRNKEAAHANSVGGGP